MATNKDKITNTNRQDKMNGKIHAKMDSRKNGKILGKEASTKNGKIKMKWEATEKLTQTEINSKDRWITLKLRNL